MHTIKSLLLVVLGLSLTSGQLPCGPASDRRIDEITAKLLTIGNSGRKFPENKEQLPKYCNDSMDILKTMEDYNKRCYKDLAKQAFSVLLYTSKNQANQICKKNSKRVDELLDAAPCGNKANAEWAKCFSIAIDGFLGTQNAEDNKKIPLLCCQYYNLIDCVEEKAKRFPICTTNRVEVVVRTINSFTANILDLLCGEFKDNTDRCKTMKPPKKKKNQRRSKSILLPVIGILSSFPPV